MMFLPEKRYDVAFDCKWEYGPLIRTIFSPTLVTIACTFAIVIITFLIFTVAKYNRETTFTETRPTSKLRARRFLIATFLLIPLCLAFSKRLQETKNSYPECRGLHLPPTQWWAIILFNILPFVDACFAWLRTLVDCLLVRWDRSLKWSSWPISIVVFVVALGFWRGLEMGVMMAMGRTGEGKDEVERNVGLDVPDMPEEEIGLMLGVREGEVEDDEITVCSSRNSEEDMVAAGGKVLA